MSVNCEEHIYIYIYIYMHISDCAQTAYKLPLLPNNRAVNNFTQIGNGVKCLMDIYSSGAGLAVTGTVRDIGQYVTLGST
jgi:hypothetical protein